MGCSFGLSNVTVRKHRVLGWSHIGSRNQHTRFLTQNLVRQRIALRERRAAPSAENLLTITIFGDHKLPEMIIHINRHVNWLTRQMKGSAG